MRFACLIAAPAFSRETVFLVRFEQFSTSHAFFFAFIISTYEEYDQESSVSSERG